MRCPPGVDPVPYGRPAVGAVPLLEDGQPGAVVTQADVAYQLEAGGQLHGVHRLLALVDEPRQVPGRREHTGMVC